jgi:hypothetical protein
LHCVVRNALAVEFQQGNTIVKALACSISAAVVLAVGAIPAAHAASSPTLQGQNPTGICNAMSPATEATLRKNPLGIRNHGTVNNLVACSMPGDDRLDGAFTVSVWLSNETTADMTIDCILVDGDLHQGVESYPKSITLAAGGIQKLTWLVTDYGIARFRSRSNLNCSLPPKSLMGVVNWAT